MGFVKDVGPSHFSSNARRRIWNGAWAKTRLTAAGESRMKCGVVAEQRLDRIHIEAADLAAVIKYNDVIDVSEPVKADVISCIKHHIWL